jgi:hypothetical protein
MALTTLPNLNGTLTPQTFNNFQSTNQAVTLTGASKSHHVESLLGSMTITAGTFSAGTSHHDQRTGQLE